MIAGILVIIAALVITGIVLRVIYGPSRRTAGQSAPPDAPEEECCGMHEVCEKFPPPPPEPVYYDDEELDRFKGRHAVSYSDAETEEFRDIMLTLAPGEAYGWHSSLRMRGIELPAQLLPELMMMISEETEGK